MFNSHTSDRRQAGQMFWSMLFSSLIRSTYNSFPTRMRSTLLVATSVDPASMNIARNLLDKYAWEDITKLEGENKIMHCPVASSDHTKSLYMWCIHQKLLDMNYIDALFTKELEQTLQRKADSITDVLFLSKHVASSGTVSLTVHPIGIPWLLDPGRSGGLPERCSPPSPHIASLYRSILKSTVDNKLDALFQVSLEATHHGPFVDIPACFVEIGSSETEWSNEAAGATWAECLGSYFNLNSKETQQEKTISIIAPSLVATIETADGTLSKMNDGIVCILIGGGHYVPKMNDIARYGEEYYIGHCLATYTLEEAFKQELESGNNNAASVIRWKKIIQEAIDATKVSFPESQIFCLVDKKAFNADQRNKIVQLLEENNLQWSYKTADAKKIPKKIKTMTIEPTRIAGKTIAVENSSISNK